MGKHGTISVYTPFIASIEKGTVCRGLASTILWSLGLLPRSQGHGEHREVVSRAWHPPGLHLAGSGLPVVDGIGVRSRVFTHGHEI